MEGSLKVPVRQRNADRVFWTAVLLALGTAATIAGFLFFQYVLGYPPCPLCLDQRIPYYIALPLAVVVAIAASVDAPRPVLLGGLLLIALAMLIGGGLGLYHAGVEWKWWAGPTDCSGPLNNFGSAGSLLQTIETTRVVRCDEAAWRMFGLSLAGYNVLVSAVLVIVALCGMAARRR